jgi:glucosamine 6-phosphate synthetase-like amidotransferase/phosphosugar isomerase protein
MLKEIHEQPDVIERLLSRYTNPERTHVKLEGINLSDDDCGGASASSFRRVAHRGMPD